MKKLSSFFYEKTNGYLVLGFLALQFIISGVVLPYFQKQFDPGLSRGLMDLSFGFTPEKGYEIIESYGEEGRKVYLFVESFIDVIYPIIYSTAFVLLLSFLIKKNDWKSYFYINLIPYGSLVFDLLENLGIVIMLKSFPERANFWANLASNSGLLKWLFAGITLLLVLINLIMWGIKKIKKQQ
ncbi:MAG: hypothetical protein ACK4NY_11300 [Spirosomataceae bacterium]